MILLNLQALDIGLFGMWGDLVYGIFNKVNKLNKCMIDLIIQIRQKIVGYIVHYAAESLKTNPEDYSVESVIKGELK